MSSFNVITIKNIKIYTIVDNDNVIWFNAKQLCLAFNYSNKKKAIANNVEECNKTNVKKMNISFNLKQKQDSIYINETGLFSFLTKSKLINTKKYTNWIIKSVLPTIREQNVLLTNYEINNFLDKAIALEKKDKLLENERINSKFPNGGMVFVTKEYEINGDAYYRIKKTTNRCKKTNVLKIVYYVRTICPLQIEICVKSMLCPYACKSNKTHYLCDLDTIKQKFAECKNYIDLVDPNSEDEPSKKYKITYFKAELNTLLETKNRSTID